MIVRNKYINQIYRETLNFCKKRGLIEKLKKSLHKSECDRFSKKSIDKKGLSVLDAVHCVVDKKRTLILLYEIDNQINNNDVVIEAGMGTGILSYVASKKARKVYSYEINHSVFRLANSIHKHLLGTGLMKDNISFIKGDARKVKLKDKADIIISENLYTGMFFEKQVEIVKSLKKNISKNGKFIPSGMTSSLFLACTKNIEVISKNKLYVVSELENKPIKMSKECVYDRIDFDKVKHDGVKYESLIHITNNGIVNSILICSDIFLPSGTVIDRHDTIFMNNNIILTFGYTIKVTKGDKIKVKIFYKYGSDPKDADILLIKS